MKRIALALAFVVCAALPARAQQNGLELWDKIYKVFSNPRCANCHVGADNIPRWSGQSYGAPRLHGMNIRGGDSRFGTESLPCSTCHTKHNSAVPHGAPGAETWTLAPVEMQWWDKSSAEICAQIKDPNRNGGRTTLNAIADHVATAPLVQWGWAPGPGREPAPYSSSAVADFIRLWDAAGSPCPQ